MTPYGQRKKRLPAPPHVVWDDLAEPRISGTRSWLVLRGDEVRPQVLEAERPTRLVWTSLWPDRPGDRVVLDLARSGSETALGFTLLAAGAPPDESRTSHLRRRVSELLFAELRYSYGQ